MTFEEQFALQYRPWLETKEQHQERVFDYILSHPPKKIEGEKEDKLGIRIA